MHIVVTRPEGQNQDLLQAIRQQDWQASALPLLEIIPFSQQSPEAAAIIKTIQQLAVYQHVIFVSSNAINCAFPWIHLYHPRLPATIRWYPIGKASGDTLSAFVAKVEQAGAQMDSEGLLENPHLHHVAGQKILIVRGQDGRMFLHDQLVARGAEVDFCELYQRKNCTYENGTLRQLLENKANIFVASSVQTVQALQTQAKKEHVTDEIYHSHLLVPGIRVADCARKMGFTAVLTSPNAGIAAIIQTLNQYNSNKKGVSCEKRK